MFGGQKPAHTSDSHDTIKQNLQSGAAVMLDVRSEEERDQGFLANSIAIPIDAFQQLPSGSESIPGLPKDKIIYCH